MIIGVVLVAMGAWLLAGKDISVMMPGADRAVSYATSGVSRTKPHGRAF